MITSTLALIALVLVISLGLGTASAVLAWRSGSVLSATLPLTLLAVPSWLLGYYISDAFDLYGLPGAAVSLGLTCSVYVHSVMVARLFNNAQVSYDAYSLYQGRTWGTLIKAAGPSLGAALPYASALVAAEVSTDFGTVNYFGVATASMALYNSWVSSWAVPAVGMLKLLLLTLGIAGLGLRRSGSIVDDLPSTGTFGRKHIWAALASVGPTLLVLSFCLIKSWQYLDGAAEFEIAPILGSLVLAAASAGLALALAAFQLAISSSVLAFVSSFMYAVPGVLIGYSLALANLPLMPSMILGLAARYSVLLIFPVSVGQVKLNDVCEIYVQSTRAKVWLKVKALQTPILVGTLLVLLDVLRELPITTMLRPPGFETLALKLNYIAKTEYLDGIGAYALALLALNLVLTSLITIFVTSASCSRKQPFGTASNSHALSTTTLSASGLGGADLR